MKKRRCFSLLLALILLASALPAAAAEPEDRLIPKTKEAPVFSDVTGTWCEGYVQTVCEAGLMEGKTADRFDPGGTLTEAQRLVIGVRLHALLHGKAVEAAAGLEPWWYPAARYYLAEEGDTEHTPASFLLTANNPATRMSFAYQIAWSVPAEDLPAVNSVAAIPDFDGPLAKEILPLYQAGILNGVDPWGSFDPQGTLTRAQAAAMLARVIDPDQRLRFTLSDFDLCRDVYQLDPKTVLLTVDGEAVPLEQVVYPLSVYLRAALANPAMDDLEQLRDDAVADVLETLAIRRLAAEKQPPRAPDPKPFLISTAGLPQAAIDAEASAYFLYQDLLALYASNGATRENLVADLESLTASMIVAFSPALDRLDLDAARARLLSSPYYYR